MAQTDTNIIDVPAPSSPNSLKTSSSPKPLPEIVQRYLAGESLTVLAKENSVNVRTIYRWLLTECGSEYEEVVTEALANRIADADIKLENASDSCQVARAREIAKFARMDFERRRPKLYGQKSEIQHDKTVNVYVHREDERKALIVNDSQ